MNDDDYYTKQQRTKKDSDSELEEDSPQVHLLNQQNIDLQPENSTSEPSQDTNTQQGDNKILIMWNAIALFTHLSNYLYVAN